MSSGSTVVSERITTQLVGKKGIQVIERRLIEQLLSEKKLSETGVVSQENLKDIGKVLDADAVVTGTLIDLIGGKTEINARLIRTDSGEVLSAAQETITRTWADAPMEPKKKMMAKKVESPMPRAPEPPPQVLEEAAPAPVPATSKKPAMKLSNESFPAGRRIYHGNQPKPNKKKPKFGTVDREDREHLEERAYEDSYADAFADAQRQKKKPAPPPPPPDQAEKRPYFPMRK